MELTFLFCVVSTILAAICTRIVHMDIITDPITTFTPIGRNATFTCETDNADTELSWIINDSILGVLYDTHVNHDVILLEKRGIFFESNGVLFTLTVKASLQNNLTEVSCRELLFVTTFETVFSATATSIVLGPPLSPAIHSSHISGTQLLLEWTEPFTWPEYDIQNYTITGITSSGGVVTHTTTDRVFSYLSPTGEMQETCEPILFMIVAVSDLGASHPANITTGLPIVPQSIGNASIHLHFQKNGMPEIIFILEPPPVCIYQLAELTLRIRLQNSEKENLAILKRNYSGEPQQVTIHFDSGLLVNREYISLITISSKAGSVSRELNFNTFSNQSTTAITNSSLSNSNLLLPGLIGIGVGLLTILLIVIVIIIFVLRRQKKRMACAAICKVVQKESEFRLDQYQFTQQSEMESVLTN